MAVVFLVVFWLIPRDLPDGGARVGDRRLAARPWLLEPIRNDLTDLIGFPYVELARDPHPRPPHRSREESRYAAIGHPWLDAGHGIGAAGP